MSMAMALEQYGPFTVAAALTSKRVGQDQKPESAIVIVGNAAFATNGWLTYPGNTDFFLKTMAWLAKEEALVSLTPKEPAFHPFVPNPSQEHLDDTPPALFSNAVDSVCAPVPYP